jgi:ankyrin repeat protein
MIRDLPMASLLVSYGAPLDVNAGFMPGETLLTETLMQNMNGCAEMVQWLVDHRADVNVPGNVGTPLMLASRACHFETMQLLLEHGADVNARDSSQATPLLALSEPRWNPAQLQRLPEAARALISRGADIHARDSSGRSVLMSAAAFSLGALVSQLLDAGADVTEVSEDGMTVLMMALSEPMGAVADPDDKVAVICSHFLSMLGREHTLPAI